VKKVILITIGITALFLGTCITPSCGNILDEEYIKPISYDKTLYVGGSGEGNYTKIQDAVDNATNGDTVYVYRGIYYERVKINKTIIFLGENRENTIIDAGGKSCPVNLEANNIYVSGFTLRNSGENYEKHAGIGIRIDFIYVESDYNTITGNRLINNINGISAIASDGNKITDNIIINNTKFGIYLKAGCEYNTIENNDIKENEYQGIRIYDSDYNKILKNTIKNNFDAGILLYDSEENEVYENIIMNGTFGIHLLDLTSRNEIYKNTIAFCNDAGIFIEYAGINVIRHNSFMNNKCHCRSLTNLLNLIMGNRFFRNYWDDHPYSKPKKIEGKVECFYMLWDLIYFLEVQCEADFNFWLLEKFFYARIFDWRYFDFFPAKEPYDI